MWPWYYTHYTDCVRDYGMARNTEKKGIVGPAAGTRKAADVTLRKRNLTLDLQASNALKRTKLEFANESAPVLSSPDIKKLKLKSPEIENIILQQNALNGATPTPNGILFPKLVTEAQENFSKGFVDALNELHGSDSSQGAFAIDSNSSNSSMTYTELDGTSRPSYNMSPSPFNPLDVVIKDEPQMVPSLADSPHMSPIDMGCQEVIKLERKRQRNRLAASKCRRRKLERISRLEDKVRGIKNENNDLHQLLVKLKDQVCILKAQVLDHANSGCQMVNYC